MKQSITEYVGVDRTSAEMAYVGLDVHRASVSVAVLLPGAEKPTEWKQGHSASLLRKLASKLKRIVAGPLLACYEAGPCGYAPQRQLLAEGVPCQVVAPSLIPVKPGERVKTDRRDARKLAELLRAGVLTAVHPPSAEQEAVRDLCRCRDDAKDNQMRERHRLNKFLLRRGVRFDTGRSHWTAAHFKWLRTLSFEHEADQETFDDYLFAVCQAQERLSRLDGKLATIAQQEPYREPVAILRCFRGFDTTSAFMLVAELYDIQRFNTPRQLMAYLGLTPSEDSSGDRTRRGSITKAGNKHVRRVLVEAAWHSRRRPLVSAALRKRREGQPSEAVLIADRAMKRTHQRYMHLVLGSNKLPTKAAVAVARELAGFVWAALTQRQDHHLAQAS